MSIFLTVLSLLTVEPPEANQRYLDCVLLVEADLELGRTAAQQWTAEGGGADAQHCQAIADIAAGFFKLGAARLEDLAQRNDAGDDRIRARLLAQAADTWLMADQVEFAKTAIKSAFEYAPDSGELHLTAAKVHGADKKWHQVVASVETAAQAGFVSANTYVLSGRAFIELGDYESASAEVIKALTLDPTNLDALVLRGEIQQTGVPIEVFYGEPDANN